MAGEADLYEVLQVSPRAEPEVVEAAYRRLARKYHPDAGDEADQARMAELNSAYETLRDPARRAAYDRRRAGAPAPAPPIPANGPHRPARPAAAHAGRTSARAAGAPTVAPPEPPPAAPGVEASRVGIACRRCRSAAYRRGRPIGWPRGEHFREGNTLKCAECGRHWRYTWTVDHPLVLDPRRQHYSPKAGRVVRKRGSLVGAALLGLLALVAIAAVVCAVAFPELTSRAVSDLMALLRQVRRP